MLIWVLSPGLWILAVQRLSHYFLARRQQYGWTPGTVTLRALCALALRLLVVITKSDVAAGICIGGGVYLSDRGHLMLGPQHIGSGTIIHDRVSIGVRAGNDVLPVIGEDVWIGPDCVIYGDISVLSMSVPARAIVAGNPAIIVRKNFDNRVLRRSLTSDIDLESLMP